MTNNINELNKREGESFSRLFELKVLGDDLENYIEIVQKLLQSLYNCVYDDSNFTKLNIIVSYVSGCVINKYDIYTGIDKHLNDVLMLLNYRYCFASTDKETERKAFYKPRVVNACKKLIKAFKDELDAVKTAYFLQDIKVNGGVINE